MQRKIFDCTTFYQANFLFKMRFEILKDYVDYFVVCEANRTHVGTKKKFNFNPKIPDKYKKKIIYIKVTDLPKIKVKDKKEYRLLRLQMENLFKGIKDANDDDLIIFSDEDEIPNPKNISKFKTSKYKFGIFLQNMYYYKLNIMNTNEGNGKWPGSRICQKKNLKSFFNLRLLKLKNIDYPFWRFDKEKNIQLIKKGGWHFTYLMEPKEISNKIKSMAHTEFNKKKFKDISFIKDNIKNMKDPFNRKLNLIKTKIDETYPEYIRKNLKNFKKWIIK